MKRLGALVAVAAIALSACGGGDPLLDGRTGPDEVLTDDGEPILISLEDSDIMDDVLTQFRVAARGQGLSDIEIECPEEAEAVPVGGDAPTVVLCEGSGTGETGNRITSVVAITVVNVHGEFEWKSSPRRD